MRPSWPRSFARARSAPPRARASSARSRCSRRLNHPGIARLFAYDDEGERPYLVLENIDGPSLSSLISKHGYVPLHQLLPLGLELSSALHYLRQEGVCHLDLKPSNVIMGAPAKLIDFSIAMDVKDATDLDEPLGSDEYMAPEQCLPGELGVVGHASDMWAFGATMFRAAAGYRAYEREPRWLQLTEEPFAAAGLRADCARGPDPRVPVE